MFNFQTRRVLREKKESAGENKIPSRDRSGWLNALLAVLIVVVLLLGYAFVRRVFIAPPMDAAVERADDMVRKGAKIQVNVLNSSSGKGIARRAMDYLRARGFDVVEIGNAHEPVMHSVVIDRVNDSLSARKVAFAMGIADSCIRSEENKKLFLDVTLVLGEDYERLKPWR